MRLESTPPESSTPDRHVGDHAPLDRLAQRREHHDRAILGAARDVVRDPRSKLSCQ